MNGISPSPALASSTGTTTTGLWTVPKDGSTSNGFHLRDAGDEDAEDGLIGLGMGGIIIMFIVQHKIIG